MQQEGRGREAGLAWRSLDHDADTTVLASIIRASEPRVPFRGVPQLAKASKL